jgi:hypothetical protein
VRPAQREFQSFFLEIILNIRDMDSGFQHQQTLSGKLQGTIGYRSAGMTTLIAMMTFLAITLILLFMSEK